MLSPHFHAFKGPSELADLYKERDCCAYNVLNLWPTSVIIPSHVPWRAPGAKEPKAKLRRLAPLAGSPDAAEPEGDEPVEAEEEKAEAEAQGAEEQQQEGAEEEEQDEAASDPPEED